MLGSQKIFALFLFLMSALFSLFPLGSPIAQAADNLTVQIVSPLKNGRGYPNLQVHAIVTSPSALEKVTASVGGVETPLTAPSCTSSTCDWRGTVALDGLPKGELTLTVTALDVNENTAQSTVLFRHDAPPVITGITPSNFTVIRDQKLQVTASAEDDLTSSPGLIVVVLDENEEILNYAYGNSSHTFDVSEYEGSQLTVMIGALDYVEPSEQPDYRLWAGYSSFAYVNVLVNSDPRLFEAERIDGAKIVDMDDERMLLLRDEGIYIRNRSTGNETWIASSFGCGPFRLTPNGALFSIYDYNYDYKLYAWNGEGYGIMDLGFYDRDMCGLAEHFSQIKGKYLIFSFEVKEYWMDTQTLEVLPLPHVISDRDKKYELMDDGTVLFEGGFDARDTIYRYDPRTGVTEPFIQFPGQPTAPIAEGDTVIFRSSEGTIYKYQNGQVTAEAQGNNYHYRNGWLAYDGAADSGVTQVFLKSPTGTVTQVTYDSYPSYVASLESDGSLFIGSNDKQLFYHQATGSLVDYSGGQLGRVMYSNGQLYRILGDTLFRVGEGMADHTPPTWPAGDALTVSGVTYNSVQLQWAPAVDSSGIDQYVIYRFGGPAVVVDGSAASYTAEGLQADTAYQFSIAARDPYGNQSSPSSLITVRTTPVPPPVPPLFALRQKAGLPEVGSTLELRIRAEQAKDMTGFLARLTYDPSLVKLQQVNLGSDFGKEGSTAVVAKNLKTPGTAVIHGSLTGGQTGRTGDLQLLIFKFTVLKEGSAVFRLLEDSKAVDSQGQTTTLDGPQSLTVRTHNLDFDGDGMIGPSDLELISRSSGLSAGQAGYEERYDLDDNGTINASDILYVSNRVAKG